MKAAGQLKILNQQPYILISHYDLAAIQHIVALAPQEAQWFHRVEKIKEGAELAYRLYDMYIPEQWCSGAEVSSDPEMFIKLYQELLKEHGLEETNNILSNMDAWCHSHHTMGVNPSGQDVKQFKEQCERAIEDKKSGPQIMLIFNKQNQYYCRVWDQESNLLFENVEMVIGNYDFSHIEEQAKAKFKKKTVKKVTGHKTQWGWDPRAMSTGGLIDFNDFELDPPQKNSPQKSGRKKKSQKSTGKKEKKSQAYKRLNQ